MKTANSILERNAVPALGWRFTAGGVWEGAETPEEYAEMFPTPAPIVEPVVITAWQLRKALTATGLRVMVEAAVANSGDQDLKDDYEYRTEFHSDNPLVLTMGAAVGKDAAGVRGLFEFAATL